MLCNPVVNMIKTLNRPSLRIISLVPSLTETLCELGLQPQIVGCTQFCVHPNSLRHTATAVGGTKDPSLEKMIALKPSHILVNTEENTADIIAQLKQRELTYGWEVVETFPKDPQESIHMVVELVRRFATEPQRLAQWQERLHSAQTKIAQEITETSYIYLIWRDPWMVAGDQTYISKLLGLKGYRNVVETSDNPTERYPILTCEHLLQTSPQKLLFSSEPFPFKKRHIEEFYRWAEQGGVSNPQSMHAHLVDGRALSWWGWGTLAGLEYLAQDLVMRRLA